MSYRRPYYLYDANLELVGTVWLDLTDPVSNARVIFDDDLGRAAGPAHMIARGRAFEDVSRGNVDDGVFPKGESPPTRPYRPLPGPSEYRRTTRGA